MARVPRVPDSLAHRRSERRRQDRIRKKEIEDVPTPPSGGPTHGVMHYGGDSVALTAGTPEVLTAGSGVTAFDPEGLWNNSTGIYAAPEAGLYLFNVELGVSGPSGVDVIEIDLTTPDSGNQDIWADGPVFKKEFTWLRHFSIPGDCSIQVTSWAGSRSAGLISFAATMLIAG